MSHNKFSGVGVALVTPFKTDFSIDFAALERIIDHVIAGGVDYLVSLGTTGEAVNLTAAECRQILDFTIQQVAGRKPIVAGFFGSNFTTKLADTIRNYKFSGIDAIMSSSPAYIKPSQEGIYQHYMAIQDASPVPVIIYNVPGRTSSNVAPETVLRLAHASEKFVAVKEASGDLTQAMRIIKSKPSHLAVVSGDDPLTLPMIACGGDGVISVIANVYPSEFTQMTHAALNNDFATARVYNDKLLDVHPLLYVEGNPSGIKAAMEIKNLCSRIPRIPLTPLSEQKYGQLRDLMASI